MSGDTEQERFAAWEKTCTEAEHEVTNFCDAVQRRDAVLDSIRRALDEIHESRKSFKAKEKPKGAKFDEVMKRMDDLEQRLHEQKERIVPRTGSLFIRLWLGRVNVHTSHLGEKLRMKGEYEKFKRRTTPFIIVMSLLAFWAKNVLIDTLFQSWLIYYYMTLALRENILRVNGSNIKNWWIWHHYLSVLLCVVCVSVISEPEFRPAYDQSKVLYLYLGLLQILQTRYQMKRLYTLRALGKASNIDVPNADAYQVHWHQSMYFLLPYLCFGWILQFYNSYIIWQVAVESKFSRVQYVVGSLLWFILGAGNLMTTSIVIHEKRKRRQAALARQKDA